MPHALMTVADLKLALPKGLQHQANQEFADKINMIVAEPEAADEVRNNFLTYAKVLQEGRYKTEDYLNAVTYCTFKIMGHTNKDAYAKTFRDRYNSLVLRGTSDKDISSYVAAYHKNKLVNTILEQAVIPSWLLNQDVFQSAINRQAWLMINSTSEKVQSDAANSLLTHLKAPETKKVELEMSVKGQGGISDLMATMEQMAQQQLTMIKSGANAREIGRTPLMIEGEAQDVTPQPTTPAKVQVSAPSGPVACAHGVTKPYPCEVCNPPAAMAEEAPEPVNLFGDLEDLRTGGDFEYAEDVVVPRQKTVALSLFGDGE
jgi:hypothetical protein